MCIILIHPETSNYSVFFAEQVLPRRSDSAALAINIVDSKLILRIQPYQAVTASVEHLQKHWTSFHLSQSFSHALQQTLFEKSCEFFEQWRSLCSSGSQLRLMKEISSSCSCMHRFFYLSYETLKLLQICLLSSPTRALLAWTLSCWGWSALGRDSCEQSVHGFSIRLAAAVLQDTNYREKMEHFFCIFITDWCSGVELLTTRLWSCVDIFFSHLHWRSEPELTTPRIRVSVS